MFETGSQMAEYGNGGGWAGEEEYGGYPQGEEEYGYGQGEEEWGQGEEEYGYGQGEEEYGYGQAEEEYGGYPQGEEEYGYGQGEEEWGEGEEEQFLPALAALVPVAAQVLGGLLGGGRKRQAEFGGYGQGETEWGEPEAGEAEEQFLPEEQFLHKILLGALGKEAEYHEAPLTPQQEAEFTERLLETADEAELSRVIGGIVNTVGRVVQGVQGAVNSPQGRAIIDAVAPVAQAALAGGAAGEVLEIESGEVDQEAGQYEAARRVVQLASAAARDVATAPPGAPPQVVGELGVIRAARHFARPLFRSALRAISPFARPSLSIRFGGSPTRPPSPPGSRARPGHRYGRPPARPYYGRRSGYGTRRYWPRYRFGYRGYGAYPAPVGYPAPVAYPPPVEAAPEPPPEPPPPPPPPPGYRWVMVPIGAPAPAPEPPPPPPPPPPEGAAGAPPAGPAPPAQSEYGYRRRRRRRRYRGYGGYRPPEEDDDQEFGAGGPS